MSKLRRLTRAVTRRLGIDGPIRRTRQLRKTRENLRAHAELSGRKLEIGPGPERIEGFETLNIVDGSAVDYICDATKSLPFPDDTFEIVYASHILEHVPWYQVQEVLCEWRRVLKPGGRLEIWVPDGLKICKAFVDAELNDDNYIDKDGWYRYNEEKDPCKWASGRLYTYGDGTGETDHPNWHRAAFSRRYLTSAMQHAGFGESGEMDRSQVRGYDHGWINMGIYGVK